MAVSHAVEPSAYLELCYKQRNARKPMTDFALVNVHKYFAQKYSISQDEPMKVLDYGCGPVFAYSICAAGANTEIVLAEFGEQNRNALQDWLDRSPSAWDWTPYIKHVTCDLEGKDESEIQTREETLRKAIKAVVPCDITKDPPIAKGYEGPYDVVLSMLYIENGCLTKQEYKAAMKRIATLVKTGGNLLLHSTVRNREEGDDTPGYYYVGEKRHIQIALPLQFVLTTLKECGFSVTKANKLPEKESRALSIGGQMDLDSTAFIVAKKL